MLIYRIILTLALPVLIWRGRDRLRARWRGPQMAAGTIWVHGASVGELNSARPVIAELPAPVLVTANTASGVAAVQGWGLPGVTAAIAPFDRQRTARRLARRLRALILIESELWPHRIAAAHDAGMPVILLSARLSARSARMWDRFSALAARLFPPVALAIPQDAGTAGRLAALGVEPARITPPVALKSLVRAAPVDPVPGLDRARTVLAASTHAGEDEVVLDAFVAARKGRPDLRLIIAPRHPDRAEAIAAAATARGLDVARRSQGQPPDAAVYLADTLHEMPLWYAHAALCFVGGSLVPRGGHTPWEPAAYGCVIAHGPEVTNFAGAYAALHASKAAIRVVDAASLATAITDHIGDTAMAARATAALAADDPGAVLSRLRAVIARSEPGGEQV